MYSYTLTDSYYHWCGLIKKPCFPVLLHAVSWLVDVTQLKDVFLLISTLHQLSALTTQAVEVPLQLLVGNLFIVIHCTLSYIVIVIYCMGSRELECYMHHWIQSLDILYLLYTLPQDRCSGHILCLVPRPFLHTKISVCRKGLGTRLSHSLPCTF